MESGKMETIFPLPLIANTKWKVIARLTCTNSGVPERRGRQTRNLRADSHRCKRKRNCGKQAID
jgi:hypothetical protein